MRRVVIAMLWSLASCAGTDESHSNQETPTPPNEQDSIRAVLHAFDEAAKKDDWVAVGKVASKASRSMLEHLVELAAGAEPVNLLAIDRVYDLSVAPKPATSSEIDHAKVSIEVSGTTATVRPPRSSPPIFLVREDAAWKVDLVRTLSPAGE